MPKLVRNETGPDFPPGTEVEYVLVPGPKGDPGTDGAPGPPGPAGSATEQNFPMPIDEWICDHNLGFTPAVMTYSSLGVQIRGLVTENGPVRTVVSFYFPVAGRMTLS